MTIHTLETEKHKDFLTQNRIDPITGDLLEENNKIVICASCKSAFLVDSWEYMDRKHCNQSLTLKEIPKNEVFKIERNMLINLFEIKTVSSFSASLLAVAPFLYPFLVFAFNSFISNPIFYSIIIVSLFLHLNSSYKNFLKIKNGILFFNKKDNLEKSFPIDTISSIRSYKSKPYFLINFIRGFFPSKNNQLYTLEIKTKNQKKYNFLLKKRDIERINKETNLLQKFNKNPLTALSVNVEIEQNLAN